MSTEAARIVDSLDSEIILKYLSWRPPRITNATILVESDPSTLFPSQRRAINVVESIPSTVLQRVHGSSSIGSLDAFSLEILHLILDSLDFRSLSRFARTCRKGKATVQSLSAYTRLITHASSALIAMNRTKLITAHSVAIIYAALLSEKCVSCQNYGPFLFLPTCERCCYECLDCDRALRVISMRTARNCFGISPKDLRRIPHLSTIPGTYDVGLELTRRRSVKLVSWKQARQLGIAVHGSEEAMNTFVTRQNVGKLTVTEAYNVLWLTRPMLERQSYRTCMLENTPNDRFPGMGATNFPFLRPDKVLEDGLWCCGCEHSNSRRFRGIEAPDSDPGMLLEALQCQARSRDEFMEHIRKCEGATKLLQRLEKHVQSGDSRELPSFVSPWPRYI